VEDHVGGHRRVQALAARQQQVEQVTLDPGHRRVTGQVRRQRRLVEQGQLADGPGGLAVHRDRSGGQELAGQAGADKTAPAGNQYVHH
jgi:hypothetical protein